MADLILVSIDASWAAFANETPKLFDLDGEANLPAWWSSAQLLTSGALVALLAIRNRRAHRQLWSLLALSGLLLLMSADETAGLHERLGGFTDRFLDRDDSVLPQTGYWPIVVGAPAAALVAWIVSVAASFIGQARRSTAHFLLAFAVFFAGALGMELLNNVGSEPLHRLMIGLEEALELAGASLLAWSALDLVARHPTTGDAWTRLLSPSDG